MYEERENWKRREKRKQSVPRGEDKKRERKTERIKE